MVRAASRSPAPPKEIPMSTLDRRASVGGAVATIICTRSAPTPALVSSDPAFLDRLRDAFDMTTLWPDAMWEKHFERSRAQFPGPDLVEFLNDWDAARTAYRQEAGLQ
jgi:hypothetical protein